MRFGASISNKHIDICMTSPDTAYDELYKKIVEHGFCEVFGGSERFEALMEKLREKTGTA